MSMFRSRGVLAVAILVTGATAHAQFDPLAVRLELLSPIRRIEVQDAGNSHPSPSAPFVVRAVSSVGTPVPNQKILVVPGVGRDVPSLWDEFGFRGFNTSGEYLFWFGGAMLQYFADTSADGTAAVAGPYFDGPPAAYVVAAAPDPWMPLRRSTWRYFSVVAVSKRPPGTPSVVVEYFNPINGHYFITIMQTEIDALEAEKFAGWQRSTGAFIAYETAQDAPPGAVPVCRFFSSRFTSHFYTANPDECDSVARNLSDVWMLETREAFYIHVPDKVTGQCPPGFQPIHRMFNNRAAPNHRYIADAALRDRMTGAGWIAEGYGGEKAVMMCTPA